MLWHVTHSGQKSPLNYHSENETFLYYALKNEAWWEKKPDVSLHKMFTLNFTWADFILGLIDGSIMALIQLLALGLIARQHNISSTCWNPTCREFYGTYCTSQSGLELRPKNFMAINIFHWIKNKVVNGALDVVSSSGSTFRSPSLFQLIYGVTKRLYLKNFTIHIYFEWNRRGSSEARTKSV